MKVINNDRQKNVEYFGADFSIPENHSYIATDSDGNIYSFYAAPNFDGEYWVAEEGCGFCCIGMAELHRAEARASLKSY